MVPDVYMIERDIVGRHGDGGRQRLVCGDDFGERIPAIAPGLAADIARTRQLVAHVVEHALVLIVGHDRVYAGVVHDELELGTREPEVERHEDGPEPGRREQHHEVRRMIQSEKGHPIAGPDASIAKRRCETIDAVEKLGIRPRLAFEGEGALLRCESRALADHPAEPNVGRVVRCHSSTLPVGRSSVARLG